MNLNKTTTSVTLAAVALLCLMIFSFGGKDDSGPARKTEKAAGPLAEVSVLDVVLAEYEAEITAYGEAKAIKQLDISSEISGRVIKTHKNLHVGQGFKKGAVLIEIEDSAYQQSLSEALAVLSENELAYSQAKQNHKQARDNWQRSGLKGSPESDLVFFEPQLKLAKANLESAKIRVLRAQYELDQSKIVAPFDLEITAKSINEGEVVSSGVGLLSVFDSSLIEVSLPLSVRQWNNLDDTLGQIVIFANQSADTQWRGRAVRQEKTIDSVSRQRALIVEVQSDDETQLMYPGSYVKALIPGRRYENLWRVPASSITEKSELWFVSQGNLLAKHKVDIVFSKGNNVYVRPFLDFSELSVLSQPLSSYLPGMKVTPKRKKVVMNNLAPANESRGL